MYYVGILQVIQCKLELSYDQVSRVIASLPQETRKQMGQTLDDLIADCNWDGVPCSLRLQNFAITIYQNIYTGNNNINSVFFFSVTTQISSISHLVIATLAMEHKTTY